MNRVGTPNAVDVPSTDPTAFGLIAVGQVERVEEDVEPQRRVQR